MALAEQGLDCMVMQAFSLGGLAAILAHLAAYIVPMKDELLPGHRELTAQDPTRTLRAQMRGLFCVCLFRHVTLIGSE